MKDIELDDTDDTFLIYCTDNSRFSLQVHEPFSRFVINDYSTVYTSIETHTNTKEKSAYLQEIDILAQENPFVFLILIVILKLSELNIISNLDAQELMGKVQPHAEALKEQWNKNIRH